MGSEKSYTDEEIENFFRRVEIFECFVRSFELISPSLSLEKRREGSEKLQRLADELTDSGISLRLRISRRLN